jgi:hypothetical protein
LLNEDGAPDQPGCGAELALLRRSKLIVQQFTTKLPPIVPLRGVRSETKLTSGALRAVQGGFKQRIAVRRQAVQTSQPD